MAFSDYLTDDEWDAGFYVYCKGGRNLSDALHFTADSLIATGYRCPGLTESGGKNHQIKSNNPYKLVMAMGLGNEYGVDPLEILDNGRTFLKAHLPDLVDETDEEWTSQMEEARSKKEAAETGPAAKGRG